MCRERSIFSIRIVEIVSRHIHCTACGLGSDLGLTAHQLKGVGTDLGLHLLGNLGGKGTGFELPSVFIDGDDELAEKYVNISAVALSNLKQYFDEKYDRNNFIKNVILDNILPSDIYIKSKELHFNTEELRVVFLIKFFGKTDMMPFEMLQNMFPDKNKDYVISVGEQDIVLVKDYIEDIKVDLKYSTADQVLSAFNLYNTFPCIPCISCSTTFVV